MKKNTVVDSECHQEDEEVHRPLPREFVIGADDPRFRIRLAGARPVVGVILPCWPGLARPPAPLAGAGGRVTKRDRYGAITTNTGRLPTVMSLPALLVAVLIGVTVPPDPSLGWAT